MRKPSTKSGTLGGTQSRRTKANLLKSLPCSNASWTHPTSVDTDAKVIHPKEGYSANRVLPKPGWTLNEYLAFANT